MFVKTGSVQPFEPGKQLKKVIFSAGANEDLDDKLSTWHREGGAADQVITAAMHGDSKQWGKLFTRLEEQHAAFEAAAEQPAKDARVHVTEVESQLAPRSALRGTLSELRTLIRCVRDRPRFLWVRLLQTENDRFTKTGSGQHTENSKWHTPRNPD